MRKVLVILIVLIAVGGFMGYRWLNTMYVTDGPLAQPTRVEVPQGSSVRGVITQLGKQGVLAQPQAVSLYLRAHSLSPKVKAGTYEFPPRASPARVFDMLERGIVVLEQVTVVEGSRFSDFRKELDAHPAVSHTLRGKTDAEVMAAIGHPNEFPEGRFFPDTYRFAARTTDKEILTLAYDGMARVLAQAWEQKKEELPISTPYEALILASIVEKETGIAQDRPMIAGVFTSRLRLGMRLQTDPSVIYGIGDKYDGDIRTKDLQTDTPYNTYTRAGLPPTPIALPGKDSVFAAVKPEETGAIFFVATGDGSGAHYFAKTLEEHNENVRRYLARQRQQNATPKHTTIQTDAR